MAPFPLDDDDVWDDLPWKLMQNGPVTKYWRRAYFEEDIAELLSRGYTVPRFDCSTWAGEGDMLRDLKVGLELPAYTGDTFDALNDSLIEIEVPEHSGVMVALDNFTERHRGDLLLNLLADASRWWLLFGRIFGVLVRTDDASYVGPLVGRTRLNWNRHEFFDPDRGLKRQRGLRARIGRLGRR